MVSSLGEEAIAAVGIFGQPKMIILCFARSLAVALTVRIARSYGAKDYQRLSMILKDALAFALVIAGLIYLVSSFFMREILWIAGAEEAYLQDAMAYALITNASLFFFGLSIVLNGSLLGLGKIKEVLYANVAGNLANVFLNYIFIYQMGWGVTGAAIATVMGSCLTLVLSLYFAHKTRQLEPFKGWGGWTKKEKELPDLLQVFRGAFMEQSFERVGMLLYYIFVARLGMLSFATHSICMTLCDVFYNFGQGFNKASLSLSAKLSGQKRLDKLSTLFDQATALCLGAASIASMLYLFFRKDLMGLYSDHPEIIGLGSQILIIVAIASFPQTLALCYSGFLRGMGYTNYVAKYSFWIIAVLRPIITYVFLFVLGLDLYGAWLALLLDQTLRMTLAGLKTRAILK